MVHCGQHVLCSGRYSHRPDRLKPLSTSSYSTNHHTHLAPMQLSIADVLVLQVPLLIISVAVVQSLRAARYCCDIAQACVVQADTG